MDRLACSKSFKACLIQSIALETKGAPPEHSIRKNLKGVSDTPFQVELGEYRFH